MNHPLQLRRIMLLLLLLAVAFAGLGYRLVDLQVVRHDELTAKAELYTQHEYWLAPRRGDILDVNGNLLAESVPVRTVCADPSFIVPQQAVVAQALAPLLQMNAADLCRRLTPRPAQTAAGQTVTNGLTYVRLQKNVSEETWRKIQGVMSNLQFGVNEKLLSKTNQAFYRNLRLNSIYTEADQMRL
jgi:cell division protein FtsI (penicillin-binding protein 3)